MVKEIQIYIEGDTSKKGKNSAISLTKGFHYFFNDLQEKAKKKNILIRPILCGSTDLTFRIFQGANRNSNNAFLCFLVDSDKPLEDKDTPKIFLQREKKWNLKNINENQCHLMVQIMESWFLADVETLKTFYSQKFNSSAIPKTKDVEKIHKTNVESSLDKATKKTQKGIYCENKLRHSAELLIKIDVIKIRQRAKHCERLFQTIEEIIDGQ